MTSSRATATPRDEDMGRAREHANGNQTPRARKDANTFGDHERRSARNGRRGGAAPERAAPAPERPRAEPPSDRKRCECR